MRYTAWYASRSNVGQLGFIFVTASVMDMVPDTLADFSVRTLKDLYSSSRARHVFVYVSIILV